MTSVMQFALIIAALLIVVNGAMDGAVSDGVSDFMFSDEKSEMRNSAYCMAGLIYLVVSETLYLDQVSPKNCEFR